MQHQRLRIAAVAAFLLAACSAGGSHSFVPGASPNGETAAAIGNRKAVKVTVNITLSTAAVARAPGRMHPKYFSPSSAGVLVTVYPTGKTVPLTQAAISVAPGSKACGKKTTFPRTCTLTLMVPLTKFALDFGIGDYNAPPARGKIPATAALLGYGKLVGKTLSATKKNNFTAYLGGVVNGLAGNPGFVSLPADGVPHDVALIVAPTDFGNNPVSGGTRDPFANPIVASVTELGGSGHALLSLDGGAPVASVTVAHSTDTVSLFYDGGASPGYGAIVTLAAPSFKGSHGASETVQVSPMYLTGSSEESSHALELRGNGDYQSIAISEVNAPGATAYTVTPANCFAIADRTTPTGNAAHATFAVLARGTISTPPPGSGCTLSVSDGMTTIEVAVSNAYSGILGAPALTEVPVPTVSAFPKTVTVGSDGAMWFAECNGSKLARTPAAKLPQTVSEFQEPMISATPIQPEGIAAGPDGNVWWADCDNSSTVGKVSPGGVATAYNTQNFQSYPKGIVAGPDDAMWFTECGHSGNAVGRVTTAGTLSYFSTGMSPAADPVGIVEGADGNLWFAECSTGMIGKITTAGTITEFPIPLSTSQPFGITAGPDGALWFSETYGSRIGRITTGGTITEYSTLTAGAGPTYVTTGPDGAIWFTENNLGKIGRIDPALAVAGTSTGVTEYLVPAGASSHPYGIGAGPDGAIWFTENAASANKIGRVAIQTSSSIRAALHPAKRR